MQLLTKGLTYTGTVESIQEAADSFTTSKGENAGSQMYCHFLGVVVKGFPDIHALQWCDYSETISQFSKGDDIKFVVTGQNTGKGRQTIKFEVVIKTGLQKARETLIKNTGASYASSQEETPKSFKDPGQPNQNPMIAGTLWSVCVGHAVQLHKDRKVTKAEAEGLMKEVIMDAELLMQDYKSKFLV